MPLTAAEKQKKYREKLKNENPQKYEEMQKKAKERSARHYKIKKSSHTEEDKLELRQKWKEDRKKAKDAKMPPQNEPSTSQASNLKQNVDRISFHNMQRRIEYRLKQENTQLRLRLDILTKGFKNLQKKIIRQQQKLDKMQNDYENCVLTLASVKETKDINVRELKEITPRKKVTEFINNIIPNVQTPKKDEIKKKLLEHDILTESLKSQFKTANNTEKNVLKKILDNEIVKNYKHKTKLRTSLGFKSNLKKYRQHKTKTTSLQNKIEYFFNRDDVSRATAGKKEYRTFKKTKRQKRYLLGKLSVLHRKFIAEEAEISFSTFKKYRPFYVLPPKITNCDSCACIKHSNMQYLVDELKSLNVLKTDNLNEVTADLVCDFNSKDCMYNNCDACSEVKLNVANDKLSDKASWYTWISKEHEYEKQGEKKKIKKIIKTQIEGTLQDLLQVFNAEIKKFKTHIFNFYYQYNKYKDCISNLKDDEACIHIDFSENFTCKYHKEIQAMHFIKEQITLHTGVVYIKGEQKPTFSFCSISPDHQHNPEAIWAHLDPVLRYIKVNYPNIYTLHFFSDGPTTQYRQKKNFYLFSEKIYEYGFSYGTWSFSEAAHGKGAADGIGGAIKRALDTKIAQGNDIPNAETAFAVLKSEDTSIKLFYISPLTIQLINTKLTPLPQTMKIHQLITAEKLKLKHRDLSCFCGDPRGSCECHSPVYHSFLPINNTNEKQSNKLKKGTKENIVRKNSKKTRQRSISSSTEEDDNDNNIEYAESDNSDYSMSLDINDDDKKLSIELDEETGVLVPKIYPHKKVTLDFNDDDNNLSIDLNEKIGTVKAKMYPNKNVTQDFNDDDNHVSIELNEKTGVVKPKIDPNKKVTLLSQVILKTPGNTKQERKRKICANEELHAMLKRTREFTNVNVNVKKHIPGNNDVTTLSQIRNAPENTASYDLGESNIFGKRDTIIKIKSKYSDKIKTDNRKIDNNKENKNYTKEEITKTLKEEEKDKIEVEYTTEKEIGEICDIKEAVKCIAIYKSGLGERYTIEIEYREEDKSNEILNVTEEGDMKETVKCKEILKTNLDIKRKYRNLKEGESNNKESNVDEEEGREGRKYEEREDESVENVQCQFIINVNYSIIVKYFIRKTWKYYVGFVKNVELKDGEKYYKVQFLKTVRESFDSVKFIVQRKLDIDIVTIISIVKKVNLFQREEASREYYMKDDNDMVLFT